MCGVFGVVLPGGEPTEAASIAALGLFALQHRGRDRPASRSATASS